MVELRTFHVMKVVQFLPGIVDGSTEDPPDDLLNKDGQVEPMALWPPGRPFEVKAIDEESAIDQAQHAWKADGAGVHQNSALKPGRYEELRSRPQPGQPGFASVIERWMVQEKGAAHWHGYGEVRVRL